MQRIGRQMCAKFVARDAERSYLALEPGGEGHSIQVEPVFTMGVSVQVGGYGLVAPCGPCVTAEMRSTPGGVDSIATPQPRPAN